MIFLLKTKNQKVMMSSKYLNPNYKYSLNQKFREKRFLFFFSLLNKIDTDQPINILDIGGTEIYWQRMNFTDKKNIRITLLNLENEPVKSMNITSIKGNACNLSLFKDKHFDIVFSNSVVEHLFTLENQKKMAEEAMRVGKNYYIQTPNYYFPIEPHWLFPFFQFLPVKVRVFLTKNFDLGNYKKSRNIADAHERVMEIKLLTVNKMKKIFPNGKVYRERFLGLVKSITMYHFPDV